MRLFSSSKPEGSSSAMPSYYTYGLLTIILFQWALFSVILTQSNQRNASVTSSSLLEHADNKLPEPSLRLSVLNDNATDSNTEVDGHPSKLTQSHQDVKWEGVALGLMLKRPRWWFKRYHFMIQNALVNIPPNWALQLMVNKEWYDRELMPYHRNLQNWMDMQGSRVIVSQLPPHLAKLKPMGVLRDRWVWENVVADHVLVFHGEGMLCSNSNKKWADFMHIDYVGVPWGKFNGYGGEGAAHSFRNRRAMLAAMDFHGGNFPANAKQDSSFVSTLFKLNELAENDTTKTKYHVATPEESNWFAGTDNLQYPNGTVNLSVVDTWGPMLVCGTQSQLSDDARNVVLGVCPELKIIFPSLHNPHCFGAGPNQARCAAWLGFPPPCSTSLSTSGNSANTIANSTASSTTTR